MPDADTEAGLEKAITFFECAEEIAATDNFDYAIDMYLESLRRAPDALEDGHIPLRRIALIRQGKGGKKASIIAKMKHRGGKTPLDEMLNAEYRLAKDPDHLPYAESMLKACVAGSYRRTADWIAQLVFDANRACAKPSLATYLLLKDCYKSLEMFTKAVEACRCAIEHRPDDDALADELMGLSAQMTVEKGKYGQEGDFRQSIRDREKQEILHSQEGLVKTAEFLAKAVEEARGAVEKNPESPANILKLAEALFDLRTDEGNEEAFEILQDALDRTKDFIFKRREGELRIKELKRDVLAAKAAARAEPENEELKNKLAESLERFAETELQHYRLCVENYPTDLRMKYEYGFRLLINKEYDKAIPLFQEAQREPQCRLAALDKTGLCFFLKGWFVDAIDIFSQALRFCEVRDSDIGKELRYNLARSYEENKQADKAIEVYRKLARLISIIRTSTGVWKS